MIILQAALTGALVGGLYAVMAVGVSLSWGTLRIINLAHFGMIGLGGYLTLELANRVGMDPLLTVLITAPLLFLLGALLQWLFQRFAVGEFNSLLISFGILIVILQLISNVWSADFQRMGAEVNPYASGALALGPFAFPMPTLLAFGFALAIVAGAHLALTRTYAGRALRAFAEDRPIAAAFGIDHQRIGILLSGLVGASAAVAGMLFAVGSSLTPSIPFEWFGVVFAIVILGGIGNVIGTLLAGMLISVVSAVVSVVWTPAVAPFVVFSVVIAAL
ncbi:MAG TPA: branched-chain amino acid ABC transporter permease, partial [Candidatus Limnocylindria bacterium]|nr:branched-chain amino acid ABC transporter permease [Candidatus Limnocylindria bacterium]